MGSGRAEHRWSAVTFAFVMGSLIGAGLGILFAPRSGQETRDRIKERTEGARRRVTETARTFRGRVEELSEAGREQFAEVRERVLEFADRMLERVFPSGGKDGL